MTNSNNSPASSSYIFSISIIALLFFIFGFVTWLNATLIPFLKISCELNNFQAYFVTFAFYISYFVMALPSSWVLHKTGFKNGIALGLFIMGVGSLIFIPAALARTYGLFLAGLFIQGAGMALLQTASNPYVTLIGPRESAAKRFGIMGVCNKTAGVLSPLIIGAIVLKGANEIVDKLKVISGSERMEFLDLLANRVLVPYVIMALVLFGLTFMIRFAHLPEVETDTEEDYYSADGTKKTSVWQFPHMVLGFISLFLYVGVEVLAADTIGLYGQSQGIPLDVARNFSALTLTFMVIGYILGIALIPRFIKQSKALAVSAALGVLFTAAALFTSGIVSVYSIALLGLANALMWPSIWPLVLADLGKFTKTASALLIMGVTGGATIPLLYGRLADVWSTQQAYCIMIPIYLFIFYYATVGYKIRK